MRKAFSLVELLVVTAVIGILVALLLPAISHAKWRGQRLQCSVNLRQIGVGLNQFVAENHVFPLFINPEFREGVYTEHSSVWYGAIRQTGMLGGQTARRRTDEEGGVWHCPGARVLVAGRLVDVPAQYWDYGYNAFGLSRRGSAESLGLGGHKGDQDYGGPIRPYAPPVKESEIVRPVNMMALGDGFEGSKGVIRDGVFGLWRVQVREDDPGSTRRAFARHQGAANVVFCDGHVETAALRSLFEDTNNAALIRWNRDNRAHEETL